MWNACRTAFDQQRTWDRARRLGLAQLVCPGRHTLSALLCTCGRQAVDWSGDYRLYSQDHWETHALFRPVVRGILDLLEPKAAFVVAMDDTVVKKTGTRIPGVAYRRDPLSPPFRVNLIRGQRFLQLSGVVPADDGSGAGRGVPVRFEHVPSVPKPKKSAPKEEWKLYRQQQRACNLSTQGVGAIRNLRDELDQQQNARDRHLIVAVDASYTNQTVLKGLPERTTLIGRIRKEAKFFYPPVPQGPARGKDNRQYGQPAPTPLALRQDETVPWQEVTAFAAGGRHTFRIKTVGPVLWKKAGAARPLRLVVIAPVGYRLRKGSKLLYRQPAYLVCTDPDLPLDQIVQDYLWRWDVEVNHRDEKQLIGVGEAQVRSEQSVERQPAFAVASYAMLLLAGVRAFEVGERRGSVPLPKWQHKEPHERFSTPELLRELRLEVWAYGLMQLPIDSDHFVTTLLPDAKCPELSLPPAAAMLYAATG
jgi:hypothetical protein